MVLFRRSRAKDEPDVEPGAAPPDEVAVPDAGSGDPPDVEPVGGGTPAETVRAPGPWDVSDPQPEGLYLDLGGLRVPAQDVAIHLEADQERHVGLVRVEIGGSELQLAPFAAPRSAGIWDEIRAEIAEQITGDGGTADDLPGPFGRELQATVLVTAPDGRSGRRRVRFLGVDGPRWFLRGVVTGPAASDPAAAQAVEAVFGGCVVVRGDQAMPPRDLLPMHLPDEATPAPAPQEPSFDPLTRGPEITETR